MTVSISSTLKLEAINDKHGNGVWDGSLDMGRILLIVCEHRFEARIGGRTIIVLPDFDGHGATFSMLELSFSHQPDTHRLRQIDEFLGGKFDVLAI
jgi:hypothetical protein